MVVITRQMNNDELVNMHENILLTYYQVKLVFQFQTW
jgi:hypothetical protein